MNFEDLLERCRGGDKLAWEALVRRYQGRVYGLALHYVGNSEEALDVAQEVFVRVYKNLDRCANADHFVPWLLRIGRNTSIDHLRRRQARPPGRDLPVEEISLRDPSLNPEDEWQRTRSKQLIHRALQTLSALSREAIVLKDIQGLKVDEMSRMLGIPVGTVKSRCNRARLELARKVRSLSGGAFGSEEINS